MPEKELNCDVLVIGGGASGMMAAFRAGELGKHTILVEKNEKLGKKLFITGKGRCNLANACPETEIFSHIPTNSKFMYSAINRFSNSDVMAFFEESGLRLKTERGDRVFPASDHSSDVIKTLEKRLRDARVDIRLNSAAEKLVIKDGICLGACVRSGNRVSSRINAKSVIVSTGGLSYPSTGSDGDGYLFAQKAGIKVTDTFPGLVPFEINGNICAKLQGLSLKNAGISINSEGKTIYKSSEPGEMLFTHFGVSGPMILTASSQIRSDLINKGLTLHIDLKPALSNDELDERIIRDFNDNLNREYKNSLKRLLPSKLIPVVTELSGIDQYKKVNMITAMERKNLVRLIKDLALEISGTRGFDEAIITRGGIAVKELDPKTFGAKKVKGLYFSGEVIDVDALTGGFNLQIAWSSGYAAGTYA